MLPMPLNRLIWSFQRSRALSAWRVHFHSSCLEVKEVIKASFRQTVRLACAKRPILPLLVVSQLHRKLKVFPGYSGISLSCSRTCCSHESQEPRRPDERLVLPRASSHSKPEKRVEKKQHMVASQTKDPSVSIESDLLQNRHCEKLIPNAVINSEQLVLYN